VTSRQFRGDARARDAGEPLGDRDLLQRSPRWSVRGRSLRALARDGWSFRPGAASVARLEARATKATAPSSCDDPGLT
jgi:hypothetical protein